MASVESVRGGNMGRMALRTAHIRSLEAVGFLPIEVPDCTFNLADFLGVVDSQSDIRWRIRRVGDRDCFENYRRVQGVGFLEMLPWEGIRELDVTFRPNRYSSSKRLEHERRPATDYVRESVRIWRQGMLRPTRLLGDSPLLLGLHGYLLQLSKLAEENLRWDLTFARFCENTGNTGLLELDYYRGMILEHDRQLQGTFPP